jgi:hypothetical protein
VPQEMVVSGPHISAAFLCEKILTERDNVPSFIRVAERFNANITPPGVQLPLGLSALPRIIQFAVVVMLKAGDLPIGRYKMRIDLLKPNGERLISQDFSVFFNGSDDNGVSVVSPMAIPDPEEGLHWFDVFFENERITRIPLRVVYQTIQFIHGAPQG